MTFAFSVAELHIPAARSLKEKRSVVRRLVDRIHHRFRVSIAETDHQDLHQRVQIAIAAVHRNAAELDSMLAAIEEVFASAPDAELLSWNPQYFEEEP